MKRYYIIDFTGCVYFKVSTIKNIAIQIKDYTYRQNKGEAKSDRIRLISCKVVSESEFNKHHYPDYSQII